METRICGATRNVQCGCSEQSVVSFTTVVVEPDGGNCAGCVVSCDDWSRDAGRPVPVQADLDGRASFEFETVSRCGRYQDCTTIEVTLLDGGAVRYATQQVNGARAVLPSVYDGGIVE